MIYTRVLILALGLFGIGIFLESNTSADDSTSASKASEIHSERLPGAPSLSADLNKKFQAMYSVRGASYKPRTKHILANGTAKYTNRLFLESSPYLLQHAHNPVNWYPWGDDAFEEAQKTGKPVLLSIGYSTCHWCHVMEEESFENEEIARYLNENYIAIKVDREERPDIDTIYMAAVQRLTGSGGWPMTTWLTPERTPFYGGTYFPANFFLSMLKRLRSEFNQNRNHITETGKALAAEIKQDLLREELGDMPSSNIFDALRTFSAQIFDPLHGGSRGKPKFPVNFPTRLLLWDYRSERNAATLSMVKTTLNKMLAGGIYDQVGGGFHRYSTDSEWLVPHFEKMLYDNALLAVTYLEAYQVTHEEVFRQAAEEILRYIERDMMSLEGAFYSATDADSLDPQGHRTEGRFFTWTADEIRSVLEPKDAELVISLYGVTSQGNYEGRNILHVAVSPEELSKKLNVPSAELTKRVEKSRQILYEARKKRPAPLRDDKILTDLNGLMISAFAKAGFAFNNENYIKRARDAANFVLSKLVQQSQLFHSYREGRAYIPAFLEDYAFFIQALIDLYEATGEIQWLKHAIDFDAVLKTNFEDSQNGGFFRTGENAEVLIAREKPSSDNVIPSGNSVSAMNLLRLAELTGNSDYRARAQKVFRAFSGQISRMPQAFYDLLLAFKFYLSKPKEIVIVTPPNARRSAEPFLAKLRSDFLPYRVLAVASEGEDLLSQSSIITPMQSKIAQQGKATAYVCELGVCKLPTTKPDEFIKQLQ